MNKYLSFFVFLLFIPANSYGQSCEYKDGVHTCSYKDVEVLREPGNSVKDVEVFLDVEEEDSDLTVFLTIDVGSNSWNFEKVRHARGSVDGTNYLFSAKRTKTNIRPLKRVGNPIYLERVVVVLQNDHYIRNVANGRSFILKINSVSLNLRQSVEDIKKAEKHFESSF